MNPFEKVFLSMELLLLFVLIIVLVYLIYRRQKIKRKEHFEKRNN